MLLFACLFRILVDGSTVQEVGIDGVAKQGAQVVDGRLSELQVVPSGFDDIGEALVALRASV